MKYDTCVAAIVCIALVGRWASPPRAAADHVQSCSTTPTVIAFVTSGGTLLGRVTARGDFIQQFGTDHLQSSFDARGHHYVELGQRATGFRIRHLFQAHKDNDDLTYPGRNVKFATTGLFESPLLTTPYVRSPYYDAGAPLFSVNVVQHRFDLTFVGRSGNAYPFSSHPGGYCRLGRP